MQPQIAERRRFAFSVPQFFTLAGIIVGLWVRWRSLGRESFWYDEGLTAWLISLQPAQIVHMVQADVAAPLYFLLLRYWAMVFGNSEAALRSLSALCASGSLILFYLLSRRVLTKPVAVVGATWLFALSSYQVEYAKDARFYALLSLFLLAAVLCLLHFLERRLRLAFVGVVLASAAGLYTHNAAIFYLFALNVMWLVYPGPTPARQRIKDLALADVLVGLLYLPWIPTVIHQTQWAKTNFAGTPPGIWDAVYILATQVAGKPFPLATLFSTIGLAPLAFPKIAGVLLLFFGTSIVVFAISRREWKSAAIALALYALIPIAIAFLRSRISTPIFIARIFIGSSPIMPLLAAIPLAAAMKPGLLRLSARLSTAAVVILSVISLFAISSLAPNENWRDVYQFVKAHGNDQTLLVFVGSDGQLPFDYYASRDPSSPRWIRTGCPHGYFDLNPPLLGRKVKSNDDLEPLKNVLSQKSWKQIAFISAHNWWADADHRVPAFLKSACILKEQKEFEQIGVMLFAPPADKLQENAASPIEP